MDSRESEQDGQRAWEISGRSIQVAHENVRYLIERGPDFLEIRAQEGETVVERSYTRRQGKIFIIEGSDHNGMEMRIHIDATGSSLVTEASIGDIEFRLETEPALHALQLTSKLKDGPKPEAPRIKEFLDWVRSNKDARREIFGGAERAIPQLPNGPIAVCVAICALCALEFVFACLRCLICVETVESV